MVAMLDSGKLKRAQLQSDIKTSIPLKSKNGKRRYQGSSALKGTQQLV